MREAAIEVETTTGTVVQAFTTGTVDWPATVGHLAYISLWILAGILVSVRRLRKKLYP